QRSHAVDVSVAAAPPGQARQQQKDGPHGHGVAGDKNRLDRHGPHQGGNAQHAQGAEDVGADDVADNQLVLAFMAQAMAAAVSGRLVPRATMVSPMTASDTPAMRARSTAPSTST